MTGTTPKATTGGTSPPASLTSSIRGPPTASAAPRAQSTIPGLDTSAVTHHVKKGQGRPAYSLFEGTTDAGQTVAELLDEHGVIDVDIAGIATDHCVRASGMDAVEHGRHVRVFTDLIAGVAPGSSEAALAELAHAGAELAESGV